MRKDLTPQFELVGIKFFFIQISIINLVNSECTWCFDWFLIIRFKHTKELLCVTPSIDYFIFIQCLNSSWYHSSFVHKIIKTLFFVKYLMHVMFWLEEQFFKLSDSNTRKNIFMCNSLNWLLFLNPVFQLFSVKWIFTTTGFDLFYISARVFIKQSWSCTYKIRLSFPEIQLILHTSKNTCWINKNEVMYQEND